MCIVFRELLNRIEEFWAELFFKFTSLRTILVFQYLWNNWAIIYEQVTLLLLNYSCFSYVLIVWGILWWFNSSYKQEENNGQNDKNKSKQNYHKQVLLNIDIKFS